jgi:hypothetical protein
MIHSYLGVSPVSEANLKMKVGEHEFSAEGSEDFVEKQLAKFEALIANLPAKTPDIVFHDIVSDPTASGSLSPALPSPKSDLTKIFRVDGRIISLVAMPNSENDAALLVMLGQKALRDNEASTGSEVKQGLELSGYAPFRVDRMMDGFVAEGLVLINGKNRGKRYRLSNPGLVRAQALADELQRKMP